MVGQFSLQACNSWYSMYIYSKYFGTIFAYGFDLNVTAEVKPVN
jgi:hypothetical protein